jgi:hypothetical protein
VTATRPTARDVTAEAAVDFVAYLGATRPLTVDLVRQWCHRGHVRRTGTAPSGRALYSTSDIVRHCERRGMFAERESSCHSVRGEACPEPDRQA